MEASEWRSKQEHLHESGRRSCRGRGETSTGSGRDCLPPGGVVSSVTAVRPEVGDPGSFFWIQRQGDFWGPLTSYLGGEVGPEARLNVVGWRVKCKHFLPPNSKPRWFIGESFRKSNLQNIPVLQKLL